MTVAFMLCILCFTFMLCSCETEISVTQRQSADALWRAQYRIAEARKSLVYFRDDGTGICFALMWGGMGNGGPGLATVDCEKVQEKLIQ